MAKKKTVTKRKKVTRKQHACLIQWDEIAGEAYTTHTKDEQEITLTRPKTDAEIAQLVQELRDLNDEEIDDDDDEEGYYWQFVAYSNCPKSSTIEWKSGRGHHAITVVVWL